MVKVMVLDGKKWKIPGERDMRHDDNDRQATIVHQMPQDCCVDYADNRSVRQFEKNDISS